MTVCGSCTFFFFSLLSIVFKDNGNSLRLSGLLYFSLFLFQLRITRLKIIFIFLDSFVLKKKHYNLLIHVFNACCTLHD